MIPTFLTPYARILIAVLLGAGIGWERERHGRAAGLRTHILLGGACSLIMLVSLHMPELFTGQNAQTVVRVDPGRIAASVLSGLGFIGAGAIIVLGAKIRGVTTAASIWVTASLGLAVGAGYIGPALFTWCLAMLALLGVSRLEHRMRKKDKYINLVMALAGRGAWMEKVRPVLEDYSLDILQWNTARSGNTQHYQIVLRHNVPVDYEEVTQQLTKTLGTGVVQTIEWTEQPDKPLVSGPKTGQ